MLKKPEPKPQPTPGSFTTAMDTIFNGNIPESYLLPHEEKTRTYEQASKALYDICDTIRDKAKKAGFQWLLKPHWIVDKEAKEKDRF